MIPNFPAPLPVCGERLGEGSEGGGEETNPHPALSLENEGEGAEGPNTHLAGAGTALVPLVTGGRAAFWLAIFFFMPISRNGDATAMEL